MTKKLLLLSTMFVACVHSSNYKKRNASVIELYTRIQSVQLENGEKVDFKDSLIIYNADNYIVYKKSVLNVSTHSETPKHTDTINIRTTQSIVKYNYIIYNKGKKYGYLYDSINSIKPKRILIDSVERNICMKGFPFFSSNDRLISSIKKNKAPFLIETRIPIKKTDDTFPDSGYYYYNTEFKNAPYSFSPELDRANDMKLYKIRFVYNPVKKGKYPIDIPKREYYFELRKANRENEIPQFIEHFKTIEAKLGASIK